MSYGLICINKFCYIKCVQKERLLHSDNTCYRLFSFRTKTSHSLSCTPNFLCTNLIQILFKSFSIVLSSTKLQSPLRLTTVLNLVIQLIKHRLLSTSNTRDQYLESIFKFRSPIQGTSSCSRRTSFIHPIHPICTDKRI